MAESPNDEDFAPQISFSVERSLLAYIEPDDYVLTVQGRICTDEDTEIGRLLGYIIQVNRAINEEQDLFEACDAHSQTATDYYEALFDHKTGEFKESIEEQLGITHVGNILILDRIEVLPAYRKHGVGLAATCSFIDTRFMPDHPAGNFKQVSQFSRALLNFLVFSCWLKFLASVFSF